MSQEPDTPGLRGALAFPPLVYILGLAAGWLLQVMFPLSPLPAPARSVVGWLLVAAWALIAIPAIVVMRQARTTLNPNRPTTALVTAGPFRLTRNPLYLALTLGYAGLAVLLNALYALILLPVILVIVQRGIIVREERYLERKFGDEYVQYKARVRRWL